MVARPDGYAAGPDQPAGVRRLPGLAEIPGAGRAHLGAARVLPGQRGLRFSRSAPGFREPDLDGSRLARRQILLHASQQFIEGDVVHWFHRLQDGRTGFVGRTHASDNLLWLAWGVVEYVGATGDDSLLEERTAYLEAEQPFPPLPAGKQGIGFDPLRSSREDTVYRHCLKAIDLVLDQRMGAHGLPLMGTGDWNDGLDEIGSQGRGESVWLGFFLYYILDRMARHRGAEGRSRPAGILSRAGCEALKSALELTWRGDRYLRAFHDDGTRDRREGERGLGDRCAHRRVGRHVGHQPRARPDRVRDGPAHPREGEHDPAGMAPAPRGYEALSRPEQSCIPRACAKTGCTAMASNGWSGPRGSWPSEPARRPARGGSADTSRRPIGSGSRSRRLPHVAAEAIETYGGQPNKQAADMVTTFDPGRMIWNGYTGAAGWMFRQALEGVLGLRLEAGAMVPSTGPGAGRRAELGRRRSRDTTRSPLRRPGELRTAPHSRSPANNQRSSDLTITDSTDTARTKPMGIISSHVRRLWRGGRLAASGLALVFAFSPKPAGLISPGHGG